MSGHWWEDDDQLLAALRQALEPEFDVPAEFTAMAKAIFTWRGIDAELAVLSYDSARERADLAGSRSESASLRSLTFTTGEFTLELEVTEDTLLGQLVPPGPGQIEARTADGNVVTMAIDEVGGFTIHPVPRGSFCLYCHAANGAKVLTKWFTLEDLPGDELAR